jgi:hypothetical protein
VSSDATPSRVTRTQPGPLATVSRHAARIKGNIVIGLLIALTVAAAFTIVRSTFTPPPTSADVANELANVITTDGGNAMPEAVGAQFLTAYLTISPDPEAQKRINTIINTLTAGEGSTWRQPASIDAVAQTVVSGPNLALPLTPSTTTPGALTGIYRAFIQIAGEDTPREVTYSVTTASGDTGIPVVTAPPALLILPEPSTPAPVSRNVDGAISAAAAPQITEYLKVWAAAGGDNTDPGVETQLKAWLAPDADRMASIGLQGAFTLKALKTVELQAPAPGSVSTTGLIQVQWEAPGGNTFLQQYGITVSTAPGGKLQINSIGPA